jgi:ATP-independent RNA helicase DbpA
MIFSDETFRTLGLKPEWVENLDQLGYERMTGIQAEALPIMLEGGDVLGHASTGTGKTAAFGLALLSRIEPGGARPGALVLCPTRELAAQVADELRRLARPLTNTNVVTICGGHPFSRQRESLSHGVDVVVGTPGRVLDHLRRETLDLSEVRTLVLDEADRMLDMGFVDDVSEVARLAPQDRQTLLFSATLTDAVRELSSSFQRDAAYISVVSEEDAPEITQFLYHIAGVERLDALQRVLGRHRPESAVIFCNQRDTCDEVVAALAEAGHSARALHGGLEQRERDDVLLMFSNRSIRLLVATNVAARGLDVEEVDAVINYELPRDTKAFVHRIGRTARAGEEGLAISIIGHKDQKKLDDLAEYFEGVEITRAGDLPDRFAPPRPAEMKTVAIQGGRKDKLRPGDIVGALTGEIGIENATIGLISVRDRITFVAVEQSVAGRALDGINAGRIKAKSFRAFMLK